MDTQGAGTTQRQEDWTAKSILDEWLDTRQKPSRRKLAFLDQLFERTLLVMNTPVEEFQENLNIDDFALLDEFFIWGWRKVISDWPRQSFTAELCLVDEGMYGAHLEEDLDKFYLESLEYDPDGEWLFIEIVAAFLDKFKSQPELEYDEGRCFEVCDSKAIQNIINNRDKLAKEDKFQRLIEGWLDETEGLSLEEKERKNKIKDQMYLQGNPRSLTYE